ncbi:MAG: nucleotidyltransferase family protein [Candidatus Omnitrophica bacterium]|nr:nucleotidyltransferase family protein [Candidatus Omnitrophota bacterium]
MKKEFDFICALVKVFLGSINSDALKKFTCQGDLDWQSVRSLLLYHELGPLAHIVLKDRKEEIPPELLEFLKTLFYGNVVRNTMLWEEFQKMNEVFYKRRIPLATLKGIGFLRTIYDKHPVRIMNDIDLLVPAEVFSEANSVFCDLGYEKELDGFKEEYWRVHQCHLAFTLQERKNFRVELHWGLDFKRKSRAAPESCWQRTRKIAEDKAPFTVLAPEDNIISLALHQRRFGKLCNLKYALDTALLLKAEGFDWQRLVSEARIQHACSALYCLLFQTKLYLNVDIPKEHLASLGVPYLRKKLLRIYLAEYTHLDPETLDQKYLFLKLHFLLYDTYWEPLWYAMNVPLEQFAKFYGLNPYFAATQKAYRVRFIYMPWRILAKINR